MVYSKVADLRATLKQSDVSWTVNPNLLDSGNLPQYSLGAVKEEFVLASKIPRLDFAKSLSDLPGNPFVYQRRVNQDILQPDKDIAAQVAVSPNLVNELTGKPPGTTLAVQLKDVTSGGN